MKKEHIRWKGKQCKSEDLLSSRAQGDVGKASKGPGIELQGMTQQLVGVGDGGGRNLQVGR